MNISIIESDNLDPFYNLAVEEILLDSVERTGPLLFIWQSREAVVIGKNQNPWRECRLDHVERDGVLLARRLSGGGAVYQDSGNLNYAVMISRVHYDASRIYHVVLEALKQTGVEAGRMGKNSLGVKGRKISGNAFCFRRNAALHHGTLLYDTDLNRLISYLKDRDPDIHTRATPSQPAPVINLRELQPSLRLDDIKKSLKETFVAEFGGSKGAAAQENFASEPPAALREKYASWEWRFGLTPSFTIQRARSFDRGNASVDIHVDKGIITSAQVVLSGRTLGSGLAGTRFDCDSIQSVLSGRVETNPDAETLARWIVYG